MESDVWFSHLENIENVRSRKKITRKNKIAKRRSRTNRLLQGLFFLVGLILCIYPLISGFFEERKQREMIATYEKNMPNVLDAEKALESAEYYNSILGQTKGAYVGEESHRILGDSGYEEQLNITGNGMMGMIQIPKIHVKLPIWHGTEREALFNGVGHLRESSLPVGGESTRCVLTGHRGLPNSSMFTRLDELKEGDFFFLKVCGKTLAYKVYGTEVIEPDDMEKLRSEEGRDVVSLVTCTPYGINTHRLIVNGERTPYEEKVFAEIKPDLFSTREVGYFMLLFVFMGMAVVRLPKKKRRRGVKKNEKNKCDDFRDNYVCSRYGSSREKCRSQRRKYQH